MKQIYSHPFSFSKIFNTATSIELIPFWKNSLFREELKNAIIKTLISFYPQARHSGFYLFHKPRDIRFAYIQARPSYPRLTPTALQLP